jgi:rod shape-determining protein MreD
LAVLVQVTVGGLLRFAGFGIASISPDFLAIIAVFVAAYAYSGVDVMLAAWVLGLAADLTTAGGFPAETAVGPMPIGYALAAGAIYRIRTVFLRERILAQVILAVGFCIIAHGLWVTLQSAIAYRYMSWAAYGQRLLQALAHSIYTAVLAPLGFWLLGRGRKVILAPAPARERRARR